MENIVAQVRKALESASDENTKKNSQRFFKERIDCYGVKAPVVQKISKEMFANVKHNTKSEIMEACDSFWQSGILEESFVACNWSSNIQKQYLPEDFKTFEYWIKNYVTNWASCDTLCNHTVGDFIMMYPDFISHLKQFATSSNRWVKRAAAVSLIIPARKGLFLTDIFEIADILLTDTDDLVQKGYGWMLKAASQAHQKEVFDYVVANKSAMPRTALRYAIEKMPKEMKIIAMAK